MCHCKQVSLHVIRISFVESVNEGNCKDMHLYGNLFLDHSLLGTCLRLSGFEKTTSFKYSPRLWYYLDQNKFRQRNNSVRIEFVSFYSLSPQELATIYQQEGSFSMCQQEKSLNSTVLGGLLKFIIPVMIIPSKGRPPPLGISVRPITLTHLHKEIYQQRRRNSRRRTVDLLWVCV